MAALILSFYTRLHTTAVMNLEALVTTLLHLWIAVEFEKDSPYTLLQRLIINVIASGCILGAYETYFLLLEFSLPDDSNITCNLYHQQNLDALQAEQGPPTLIDDVAVNVIRERKLSSGDKFANPLWIRYDLQGRRAVQSTFYASTAHGEWLERAERRAFACEFYAKTQSMLARIEAREAAARARSQPPALEPALIPATAFTAPSPPTLVMQPAALPSVFVAPTPSVPVGNPPPRQQYQQYQLTAPVVNLQAPTAQKAPVVLSPQPCIEDLPNEMDWQQRTPPVFQLEAAVPQTAPVVFTPPPVVGNVLPQQHIRQSAPPAPAPLSVTPPVLAVPVSTAAEAAFVTRSLPTSQPGALQTLQARPLASPIGENLGGEPITRAGAVSEVPKGAVSTLEVESSVVQSEEQRVLEKQPVEHPVLGGSCGNSPEPVDESLYYWCDTGEPIGGVQDEIVPVQELQTGEDVLRSPVPVNATAAEDVFSAPIPLDDLSDPGDDAKRQGDDFLVDLADEWKTRGTTNQSALMIPVPNAALTEKSSMSAAAVQEETQQIAQQQTPPATPPPCSTPVVTAANRDTQAAAAQALNEKFAALQVNRTPDDESDDERKPKLRRSEPSKKKEMGRVEKPKSAVNTAATKRSSQSRPSTTKIAALERELPSSEERDVVLRNPLGEDVVEAHWKILKMFELDRRALHIALNAKFIHIQRYAFNCPRGIAVFERIKRHLNWILEWALVVNETVSSDRVRMQDIENWDLEGFKDLLLQAQQVVPHNLALIDAVTHFFRFSVIFYTHSTKLIEEQLLRDREPSSKAKAPEKNPLEGLNKRQAHGMIRDWMDEKDPDMRAIVAVAKSSGPESAWTQFYEYKIGQDFITETLQHLQWVLEWCWWPEEEIVDESLLKPRDVKKVGLMGSNWKRLSRILGFGVQMNPEDEELIAIWKRIRKIEENFHVYARTADEKVKSKQPTIPKTTETSTSTPPGRARQGPANRVATRAPATQSQRSTQPSRIEHPVLRSRPQPNVKQPGRSGNVSTAASSASANRIVRPRPSKEPTSSMTDAALRTSKDKKLLAMANALIEIAEPAEKSRTELPKEGELNPLLSQTFADARWAIDDRMSECVSDVDYFWALHEEYGSAIAWEKFIGGDEKRLWTDIGLFGTVSNVMKWIEEWAIRVDRTVDRRKLPKAESERIGLKGKGWDRLEKMLEDGGSRTKEMWTNAKKLRKALHGR